jgi:hypothetical protein
MRYSNRANLPPHLFNVLKAAHEKAQENYGKDRPAGSKIVSVTELIGPAQKRRIEQAHRLELETDVLDTVPALRGTSLHHILELAGSAAPEAIPEERLQTTYDTWTITGKSDLYTTGDGRLIDFKDSSVWAYLLGKREWDAQLNVLRWIRVRNGGHVASLEVDLFVGDWRKGESKKNEDYPERVVVVPIVMWEMDETEKYVKERLAMHAAVLPPECSAEERWEKPTKWAAMKLGAAKATKLFDEPTEAARFASTLPKGIVEKRPGQSTRCADYCQALPWCAQGQALVNGGAE